MRAWAAAALVVLACPMVAAAATQNVTLAEPHVRLTPQPPLTGGGGGATIVPRLGLGRMRERVAVGVDVAGRPVRITVVQRIEVVRPGDYSFDVPAPVLDVSAPAGARVQPGLLDGAIVWQGFSPGRRTLVARASLDVAKAAPFLPVAVEVRTLVDGRPLEPGEQRSGRLETVLTVRNRTAVRVPGVRGTGSPVRLAAFLDWSRRRRARNQVTATTTVPARVSRVGLTAVAPFEVAGVLELPPSARDIRVQGGTRVGSKVEFGGPLGGPLTVRVNAHVARAAAPRVAFSATPQPLAALAPPGGGTWRAALASGRIDPARVFDAAVAAMLRLARVNQYAEFLDGPGPPEKATAVYVYATSAVASVTPAPSPQRDDGASTLLTVVLGVAGLGAAVVAWAYL